MRQDSGAAKKTAHLRGAKKSAPAELKKQVISAEQTNNFGGAKKTAHLSGAKKSAPAELEKQLQAIIFLIPIRISAKLKKQFISAEKNWACGASSVLKVFYEQ